MMTMMTSETPWILKFVCCLFVSVVQGADPVVDVALRKTVTAQLTCGFNRPEKFTSQRFAGYSQQSNSQYCNNTSMYPPESIVDGNEDTWWQSTSRINFVNAGYGVNGLPDAQITVVLQQSFTVEKIEIRFGESQRPGRMTFYKSSSTDQQPPNTEWFFVVSSALDCTTKHGVSALQFSQISSSTDRPCVPYTTGASLNELIRLDLSRTRPEFKEWNSAASVKVAFYEIYLSMGVTPSSNEYQHYTVRSLNVLAKCKCNNQLTDCLVNSSTGKYSCVCGNFTTGENCERCLPLYNNRAYTYGRTCEACDCNGHADSCIYDAGLQSGVCMICLNQTAGPKCDKCVDNYYRPLSVLATNPNPCVPCNCSGVYVVGGCFPAQDSSGSSGMNPGDCYCKPNVAGSNCDRCKDGFYGLSISGCRDCACLINGTVGGSALCNETGQCQCKPFTAGLRCDTCLDGYYNLDPSNPNGCTPCSCDVGGALTPTCDKVTGQCLCRANVIGRTCNQPAAGFYYPDFYFLSSEMENINNPWDSSTFPGFSGFGYVKTVAQVPVSTTINLAPMGVGGSDSFKIVLKYLYPSTGAPISGTMTVGEGNTMTSSTSFNLSACDSSWCFSATESVKLSRAFPSTISFTFPDQVFIDRISAVPSEYFDASRLFGQPDNTTFQILCNLLSKDLYVYGELKSDCARFAFSLSTWYLDGALPCNCDPLGANDTTSCSPNRGQCFCKNGATGRRCGTCMPRYYNLGSSGCTPCSCNQTTYNMCDSVTGSCLCPPGSEGENCTVCKPNHYNWDAKTGCLPCGCNAVGSRSPECDVSSGKCPCKTGVAGLKCEKCEDGFKEMTVLGCSTCNCDSSGTLSGTFCDKVTGNCVCKANVGGTSCNSCKLDSFTISSELGDGCLSCLCMGITKTCSMANWLPTTFATRPNPMNFAVLNSDGTPSAVGTPTPFNGSLNGASINVPPSQNIYWSDPQLKGNMLSFYGASISFKVMWIAADSSAASPTQTSVIFLGTNGQAINFLLSNYSPPPSNTITQFKATISLENTPSFASSGLTRAKILIALTDVKAVLFPATFKPTIHQSSITDMVYETNPYYVEQCFCPAGYEGRSCESCSVGYMRYNVIEQGYLGLCRACECNGKSTSCDPISGYCSNCQQFTTGVNCESCLSGYYRDPSSGSCVKCPCQGSRVSSNECGLSNSSVVCLNCTPGYLGNQCDRCAPGYYGNLGSDLMGTCKPCVCNGFSFECDSLGKCLNCSNFTDGDNCERCKPEKFKDPVTVQCVDCNCNMTGSDSNACDYLTGQCPCKSGITSLKCDSCMDHYYNFSSTGCLPCFCNEIGSENLSCNQTGTCTCKPHTISDKCDRCEIGSFGILNGLPCQLCNCDPNGVSENNLDFTKCNVTSGQCTCRPHVIGRTCDRCELMYFNVSEHLNCTACKGCQTALGMNVTKMETEARNTFLVQTSKLELLQQTYENFTKFESQTIHICLTLGGCVDSNFYEKFKNQLRAENEFAVSNETKTRELRNLLGNLSFALDDLSNKSEQTMTKILAIKRDADFLFNDFGLKLTSSMSTLRTLQTYNETADKIWKSPPFNGTNLTIVQWNNGGLFNKENASLHDLISRTASAIQTAKELVANLALPTNTVNQMIINLVASERLFAGTTEIIKTLNSSLVVYNGRLNERITEISGAITLRASFNVAYQNLIDVVRKIHSTLASSAANLAVCKSRMSNAISLILGSVTPPLQALNGTDFTGWNQAYTTVDQMLKDGWRTLNNSLSDIARAEQRAASLSTQANGILSSFQAVQPRGQPAVDVFNRFKTVTTNLVNSITQAQDIDGTLQNILRSLGSVSMSDLALLANQLLARTNLTQQDLNTFLYTTSASGLNAAIDSANSSLQASVDLWASLNGKIESFNQNSLEFRNFITNTVKQNNQNYNKGTQLADYLASRVNSLRQSNNMLQSTLDGTANSVGNVANTIANSLNIQNQLMTNITTFQTEFDAANTSAINNLNISQTSIQPKKSSLEEQFAKVDELLKQAQAKMAALEQPVYFSGSTFEQVTNPDTGSDQLYNSIGLEFSYNYVPRGILFFAENNQTQEKLLLQLINKTVCFEFSFSDVKTLLCNAAQLSARNWFRVYVTRYEADAKLTVEQQSTGGTLAVSARAVSTNSNRIRLTSQIFVGGLALNNANIRKVYDSGAGFNGCVYNVQYNGASLPVWQSILRSTSTATCCRKPSVNERLSYIANCVTFYGFGYVMYSPKDTFSLASAAQVSFHFRTFARHGVMFLSSTLSNSDYYGLFIQDGKVLFSIASGSSVSIVTDNAYNNGLWFKLSASHNAVTMTLTVAAVNSTQFETKTTPAIINLSSLSGEGFIIGGQHPSYVRGPVSRSFSGSIKDFQHTTTFSGTIPLPDSLTTGIISSVNVDLTRCLENVQAGLGFSNRSSYSIIRPLVSPISTIEFTFITRAFSGVLMFAYLEKPSDQNTFLYICLYNGDIFILFNQGIGIQPIFRTRNLFLSNGLEHKVSLSFIFTNSPRMRVDNLEAHVGAMNMNPYMKLLDNTIYVGGVPATLSLDPNVLPVKLSFIGGIKQISLNDVPVQLYDPAVLSGTTSRAIYLSGIQMPLPPAAALCDPCPTTSAPLACILPPSINEVYDSNTLGFSLETENYIQYSIKGDEGIFLTGFECSIAFRSLQPDGLLAYISGPSSQSPLNYFAVYLFKGAVNVAVSNGNPQIRVASKNTYYDGLWHKVSIFMTANSLAVLVQESQDFNNNIYNGTYALVVNTPLYAGGVPYALTPFPDAILSGKASFKGCLQGITFQTSNRRTIPMTTGKMISSKGLSSCSINSKMGMSIASTGYIRVSDSYNSNPLYDLVPPFTISLTFKTSMTAGVLMVAWTSSSRFVSMSIVEGEVQVILSSSLQPFIFTSKAFKTGYTICDNSFHNVTMTINVASVTLNINGNYTETKNFESFQYAAPLSVPIYLGGVKDTSWNIPSLFSSTGFVGCMQRCRINGNYIHITQSADVNGALSGCV